MQGGCCSSFKIEIKDENQGTTYWESRHGFPGDEDEIWTQWSCGSIVVCFIITQFLLRSNYYNIIRLTLKSIDIDFSDQFQNNTEGCRDEHINDKANNQEGDGRVCHCYEDLCNKEVPGFSGGSQVTFNGVAVIIIMALFVNIFNQY